MANHITCPGCRILLAIPDRLAGKVLRCPRCKTALSEAEAEEVVNTSEAITDRLTTPAGSGTPSRPSQSRESESRGTEARIQMKCERCGDTLIFASTEMGTVQECAACGEYIDVPDLTSERYERQLRETDRLLEKQEGILDRWEALVDRLERALARWEQLRS